MAKPMTKAEAIKVFEELRKVVKLTGEEHDLIRNAIDTIKTLKEEQHKE